MLDKPGVFRLMRAKVRALFSEHWRGEAGAQVRETVDKITDYTKQRIRLGERLEEAPNVLWNTAKIKSSEALVNAAEEEEKRIASELARRTLPDKVRQEKATADRLETDARISKIKEMEEGLSFVEKLRGLGVVPVWDSRGTMLFLKAPPDYDWDGLMSRLLTTPDLSLFEDQVTSNVNIKASGQVTIGGNAEVEASTKSSARAVFRAAPPWGLQGSFKHARKNNSDWELISFV